MKKALVIFGIGLVTGATTYAIWKRSNVKPGEAASPTENQKEKSPLIVVEPIVESTTATAKTVDYIERMTAESISNRHEEAVQIMRDAVDLIYKRSEVHENEELDQISKALEELLDEE